VDEFAPQCSAIVCATCLLYQCNIRARTVVSGTNETTIEFSYTSSSLINIGHTQAPEEQDASSYNYLPCPGGIASVWMDENDSPMLLINLPNNRKV